MMIGTHSLLPVCGCLFANRTAKMVGKPRLFTGSSLCIIGAFGMLPDILAPHFSLEARQSSLSHTVWFLIVLATFTPLIGRLARRGSRIAMGIACWMAAVLHLTVDAISGGIAWLYPWRDDVIGRYFIPPQDWIWYDVAFIVFVWSLYRVIPHYKRKRESIS